MAAICGILLALVAASIGISQIITHAGGAATGDGRATVAGAPAAIPEEERAPDAGRQRTTARYSRPVADSGAGGRLTIFLVASPEQADQVRAALDQGDEILTQQGQPLPSTEVVLAGSAPDEVRVRQVIEEADVTRKGMGLPPATVIDLRIPDAPARAHGRWARHA
jgi:hypothetical protein